MKEAFAIYSVVLTTEFVARQSRAALSFRNHYSETRFAARGDHGTTPKLNFLPAGDEWSFSFALFRSGLIRSKPRESLSRQLRIAPVPLRHSKTVRSMADRARPPVTLTCQPGGSRGSSVCRTRGSRSPAKGSWGRETRCGRICGSDNRCACGRSCRARGARRRAR